MKKEMKDYTGLSLKIVGVSFLIMLSAMCLGATISSFIDDIHNSLCFEILRVFVLGSYGVVVLSILYFFISVIYNQFKDKRILWGIINIILLISFLYLRSEESDDAMLPFIILLISCLKYYFSYIKPKLAKKKKK